MGLKVCSWSQPRMAIALPSQTGRRSCRACSRRAWAGARAAKGRQLTNFEALGLSSSLLKSIESLGYDTPTPIQEQGIPVVLSGRDIMGLAQTGTGKTAAFGLPLVHQI